LAAISCQLMGAALRCHLTGLCLVTTMVLLQCAPIAYLHCRKIAMCMYVHVALMH
jgi:hypothetical protein